MSFVIASKSGDRQISAISADSDFAILVEALWNQLFVWYGGGPPIAVPIDRDPFNSLVVAWPKFPVTLLYRHPVDIHSRSLLPCW
jgi:hypothetical protein